MVWNAFIVYVRMFAIIYCGNCLCFSLAEQFRYSLECFVDEKCNQGSDKDDEDAEDDAYPFEGADNAGKEDVGVFEILLYQIGDSGHCYQNVVQLTCNRHYVRYEVNR